MSRLADPTLPAEYDKARLESVLRALIGQVNSVSEGAAAGRYQSQASVPSGTAVNVATSDIIWDSNATLYASVASGVGLEYIRLGWIVRAPGTAASATISEIRALAGSGTLASAPFVDTTSLVKGSVDGTKQFRLEADGITAGATRVGTLQDRDGTIAYTSDQTFTGTCSAPTAATATSTTQLATTAFVQQESGARFLASGSISAATVMNVPLAAFVSSYSTIMIKLEKLQPGTDDVQLWMRFSTGGTSIPDSGAADYAWSFTAKRTSGLAIAGADASDSEIEMASTSAGVGIDSTSTGGWSGVVYLHGPGDSSLLTRANWIGSYLMSTTEAVSAGDGIGIRLTAQTTTGVHFQMSSGTMSGSWSAYGLP